jgi:hypothetical protein
MKAYGTVKIKKKRFQEKKKIHEGLKKTWHYSTVKIKKNRFQAKKKSMKGSKYYKG